MIGYDKHLLNHQLLVGLTFEEMTGALAWDRAKPHHPFTLEDPGAGTITWGNLVSGFPVLTLAPGVGAANYVWVECASGPAADLDFALATDDFTLVAWVRPTDLSVVNCVMCYGAQAVAGGGGYQMVIGIDGRLGFATCQGALVQTSQSYPLITINNWWLVGATRAGAVGLNYINGLEQTDAPDTHITPTTQTEPFHVGVRQTGSGPITYDAPFVGDFAYPRVVHKKLEPWGMLELFNLERHWFGV